MIIVRAKLSTEQFNAIRDRHLIVLRIARGDRVVIFHIDGERVTLGPPAMWVKSSELVAA